MRVCTCGIHTGVGKTSVSAALCYAFMLDYFKIVQAGSGVYNGENIIEDKEVIASLSNARIFNNGITLKAPKSPHIAMKEEGILYSLTDIKMPASENLVIESAGGILTPLDGKSCMLDFVLLHNLPVILVSSNYLGAINHTLLSLEILKVKKINVLFGIFSGGVDINFSSFIESYSGVKFFNFKHYSSKDEFIKNADLLREELQNSEFKNCFKL
ncbi:MULTISPECIES: dethiobiotin synthase [Helicobacter]|uniref:ATP-dependent dethiobiotin synthetase BioD n=1 Tax=Helicobacter ibis TaxID=2962633 RepID=A0ABT4VF07_9HELI|nr:MULTISPECIES: dethiobiotin synthase [Helicobacter]MDA3967142.1 dethiobiotin synthase [Helicobacter sp. WB40]MDA3969270.1 dethiobiotin synthase [Helicobacter ibis]